MRRQGEGWKDDLLHLLSEMGDLYEAGQNVVVMSP